MHIGLVIYGDLEVISGGYLYDRQLVSYWRANGHRVTIFSLPWRNYWRHFSDNFSRKWIQQLIHSDLDVLVQDELNHPSLVGLNYYLRRRVTYPIISIIHLLRSSEPHSIFTKGLYRQIESSYLTQMDGFIFNSYDTMREVRLLCKQAIPSVMAYPGGNHLKLSLSADAISNRAQEEGPLRILYVGNYIERKGLHLLLSTLAQLDASTWELTAIGRQDLEPGYVKRLRKIVENGRFQHQVKLLGPVPHKEIAAYFQSHQLFAMLSLYEPFGIVYLEAMSAGLPVIASTAGAGKEFIKHGRNGYLVPPRESADLLTYFKNLHKDRALLTQMGHHAQAHHAQHPTWEETGREVTRFLEDVILSVRRKSEA